MKANENCIYIWPRLLEFLCEKYKKKKKYKQTYSFAQSGKQPFGNSGYLEYSNK